jgi:hypothetical protein
MDFFIRAVRAIKRLSWGMHIEKGLFGLWSFVVLGRYLKASD